MGDYVKKHLMKWSIALHARKEEIDFISSKKICMKSVKQVFQGSVWSAAVEAFNSNLQKRSLLLGLSALCFCHCILNLFVQGDSGDAVTTTTVTAAQLGLHLYNLLDF